MTFLNCKGKEKNSIRIKERKQITYKGVKFRLILHFSLATLNAENNGTISTVYRENYFEPRIIYLDKLSFLHKDNWETFTDIQLLIMYHPSTIQKNLLNELL